MGLVLKWPFFQLYFLRNIGQENVFYDILKRKNLFLGYKNQMFKKSKNWHLSKGVNPLLLVQKWPFVPLFFSNIGQKNVFYDILDQKNALIGYKQKKLKKLKNWHFSKGVKPWFWYKNGHFPTFFLGNIHQEHVFYNILERKNAFLRYKNKTFKKLKNWHFSKGVNPWFCSKMAIFSTFFLGSINEENVSYDILERKTPI